MWANTTLRAALVAAPVALALADIVGYVARVEGSSMRPTLNPDDSKCDYVFLSRSATRSLDLKRGDIVSLIAPKDPDRIIIKRIVALQGETVRTNGYSRAFVRIPEGHCWVEGDHKGHTIDSNNFGPVSLGLITGKAVSVVWPPERWQKLESKIPERFAM